VISDYEFYLEQGCRDVSGSLGIQAMPEGYRLMLNADESHFFWFRLDDSRESSIHWSKWAVYRGAKHDHARLQEAGDE
jgi:hypothetical protein